MKTSRLASPANPSGALHLRVPTSARSVVGRFFFSSISRRLAGIVCHGLLACLATASAVNLKWDPNPEADIASYRVNYGTSSGTRPNSVSAGLNTRTSVTGLQEGTTYYFTVTAINTTGQESEPSDEISYQVPVTTGNPVTVIPRTGWALQYVDSQETGNYAAANAFDGNPATFWHTAFSSGTTPLPHEIRIDLGAVHPVNGFRYLPRQDALLTGNISQYEFYTSLDGTTWGSPVASGTFANSSSEKEVLFAVRNARYVRLRSFSEVGGGNDSNVAELNILQGETVNPPANQAPVAVSKSASTSEDTPVAIALSASDADGQSLTYSVVSGPAKGSLSGTAPNLTYTPNVDTNGADSFTYKANDGTIDSNTATVSITVNAVNDAPVAVSKSAVTNEDTPVSITLAGSDKEGNSLTWSIVTPPAKGTLSGTAPNLTYTPNADTNGADSFTYKANDGTVNSNTATVSITVNKTTAPDDADLIARTGWTLKYVDSEDTSYYAATNAFDGDPDTFWHTRWQSNATPPPHEIQIDLGRIYTLHGFRYLPRQDATLVGTIGQYEFYTSLDGKTWGTPVAAGTFANSAEEKEVLFTAGNARYVRLRSLAEVNGAMHCSIAELNVLGTAAANVAPKADSKTVTTPEETPIAITLGGSDPDGDLLTWSVTGGPSNGTLSGTVPNVTYTPAAGFSGSDSFTYQANDGSVSSAAATVSIKVTPKGNTKVNRPPVFESNPITLQSGFEGKSYTGVSIADAASDPDRGDSITFSKVAGPEWLEISAAGKLSGTPPAGSGGANRFTVRATDKADAYAESILLIDIAAADLPLPWDLERIGKISGKSRAAHKAGTFTLASPGNLAGKSDSGGFIWQTLTGDGEIIARVNGLDDAGKTSRAGLMIRDTLAVNSRHVFIGVNGGGDFRWVCRTRTGGQAVVKTAGAGVVPNVWLRLVRKGETITASKSTNGSDWTRVGSTTADFGKNCYIGLSISSGDATPSTATFRGVTVNP